MQIKKIIVDEKPKSCNKCLFQGCDFMDCDMFGGDCPLCEENPQIINDEYIKRLEMSIKQLDLQKENERMIARGIRIARWIYKRWKNEEQIE